jgi:O-antigen ligase
MATEQLSWRTSADRTPAVWGFFLLLVSILVLGIALGSSTYLGQTTVALALVIASGGFVFVVAQPALAILVLISTMLLTYPDVLTGHGLLTINNLLGVTLFLILLVRVYLSHDTWLLRERELQLLVLIFLSALLLTAAAEALLPNVANTLVVETKNGLFRPARDLTVSRFKDFFSRIAFFIFFVYFISTKKQVKWVLLTILACILVALPPAFSNLLNDVTNDFRVTAGFNLGRGSGWLSNPNRFAFMCLLGMSLVFYFSTTVKNRLFTFITILFGLAFATLILFSGSRSGLLSLLVTGGWLLLRGGVMSWQARLGVSLFALVAVLSIFPTLPPRLQVRLLNINPFSPEGEGTNSTEVRVATLVESTGIFAQYPLTGVGIGNFRWVNFYYNNNFKPPHNSYMWALAEGGIICAVLYGILFFTLFRRLRMLRRLYRDDPNLPHIGEWLSFYLVAFLFFSFFADIWLEEIHLYLIAGLAIVVHRLSVQETLDAPGSSRVLH